MQKCDLKNML